MALLFCAWIGVLVVLNWSFTLPVGTTHHHVNAFAVMALYFSGGIVAGAMLGLLRPLQRTLVGAMVTGLVAALPFFAGCALLTHRLSQWDTTDTIVTLASALLVGPMSGAMIFALAREFEKAPKSREEEERNRATHL